MGERLSKLTARKVLQEGRIRAQTIHYTVISSALSVAAIRADPERRPPVRAPEDER